MSSAERRALFEASIVTNLDDTPQSLVERARPRTYANNRRFNSCPRHHCDVARHRKGPDRLSSGPDLLVLGALDS